MQHAASPPLPQEIAVGVATDIQGSSILSSGWGLEVQGSHGDQISFYSTSEGSDEKSLQLLDSTLCT